MEEASCLCVPSIGGITTAGMHRGRASVAPRRIICHHAQGGFPFPRSKPGCDGFLPGGALRAACRRDRTRRSSSLSRGGASNSRKDAPSSPVSVSARRGLSPCLVPRSQGGFAPDGLPCGDLGDLLGADSSSRVRQLQARVYACQEYSPRRRGLCRALSRCSGGIREGRTRIPRRLTGERACTVTPMSSVGSVKDVFFVARSSQPPRRAWLFTLPWACRGDGDRFQVFLRGSLPNGSRTEPSSARDSSSEDPIQARRPFATEIGADWRRWRGWSLVRHEHCGVFGR